MAVKPKEKTTMRTFQKAHMEGSQRDTGTVKEYVGFKEEVV